MIKKIAMLTVIATLILSMAAPALATDYLCNPKSMKLPGSSVRKELSALADKGYITKTGSPRKTIYIFSKIIEIMNI